MKKSTKIIFRIAQIAAAIIGSSTDTRATVSYQKVYFIRNNSGELKRIEEQTSDPVLLRYCR